MTRIFTSARLQRSLQKLSPELKAKAEEQLNALRERFGDPHRHRGLGLRQLTHDAYEVRVTLALRIVLTQETDGLYAFDIMDHDELRRWLKGQR